MFTHPRRLRCRAVVSALFFTMVAAFAAEGPTDPSVLKAQVWDQDVVIGAGAYRGTKVVSKAKPKHKILPGALIEKTEFAADGQAQWDVEGALLRDCSFHGDLGTQVKAKNSAVEACLFRKSGGWFVGWAGTRWKFENCVFTRSFMPANPGVHDHSVQAIGCTFNGIKMPHFGLKKNPAQGVQGKDLQFVRCKFVNCEIPETTLALTIDCAFENCQFETKKFDWEKAEGPVNVKAYITAGRVPPSYVNTKLNVTFESGQPPQLPGAQLEHTLAGPRILMPWAQRVQSFNDLGTVKKSASEIPVLAAPASALPPSKPIASATPPAAVAPAAPVPAPAAPTPAAPPPAPGGFNFFNLPTPKPAPGATPPPTNVAVKPSSVPAPAPAPAAPPKPAVREVRALDELLAVVPLDQTLVTAGRVSPAALDAANAVVDQASAGKPAALRVPFDELIAHRKDGYAFKLRGQPQPLSLRGQAVIGRVEVLFRADQGASLSRLGKGSVVTVKGIISKAELEGARNTVTFTVLIADGVTTL